MGRLVSDTQMHVYLIRKVVSVKECNQDYMVDGVMCNKVRS